MDIYPVFIFFLLLSGAIYIWVLTQRVSRLEEERDRLQGEIANLADVTDAITEEIHIIHPDD